MITIIPAAISSKAPIQNPNPKGRPSNPQISIIAPAGFGFFLTNSAPINPMNARIPPMMPANNGFACPPNATMNAPITWINGAASNPIIPPAIPIFDAKFWSAIFYSTTSQYAVNPTILHLS